MQPKQGGAIRGCMAEIRSESADLVDIGRLGLGCLALGRLGLNVFVLGWFVLTHSFDS